MPILTWPAAVKPNDADWGYVPNTQEYRSDLNGVVQNGELPGGRWVATYTFSKRAGSAARILRAFLMQLGGPAGRFYLSPPDYEGPEGSALGSGVVNGADQTGLTLVTDGWTANQSGLVLAGDYIQVGNELKMITADIDSDASGNATLQFSPALRVSPADGAAIITANPTCIMKLEDEDQITWSVQSPVIYGLSLSMEEALDL